MTVSYTNPFHSPKFQGSTAVITTDATPVEYKGFLIYQRIKSNAKGADVFDVVKDGTCIAVRAGINGAKRAIDLLTKNTKS